MKGRTTVFRLIQRMEIRGVNIRSSITIQHILIFCGVQYNMQAYFFSGSLGGRAVIIVTKTDKHLTKDLNNRKFDILLIIRLSTTHTIFTTLDLHNKYNESCSRFLTRRRFLPR